MEKNIKNVKIWVNMASINRVAMTTNINFDAKSFHNRVLQTILVKVIKYDWNYLNIKKVFES